MPFYESGLISLGWRWQETCTTWTCLQSLRCCFPRSCLIWPFLLSNLPPMHRIAPRYLKTGHLLRLLAFHTNICTENLQSFSMQSVTTASPKIPLRAPWTVGNTAVGKTNAGWTTSKAEHPCPYQNCSHRPPDEKTAGGTLLTSASYWKDYKRIPAESTILPPWWPNQSREWSEHFQDKRSTPETCK